MDDGYILELPWPPTINHAKGFHQVISKRTKKPINVVYTSKETKLYRQKVHLCFIMQHGKRYEKEKVKIEIEAYPPDDRKRDLDNLLKTLLDALQIAGAIENDFQVYLLRIERKEKVKFGKLLVTITPI